jgi:uncharacterized protein YdeI (YjbR/CyaY-like superfamily)
MPDHNSNLSRPIHPMPDFVREALRSNQLMDAYDARPDYQRNDYIGWIMRAKRDETRQKRLSQMLGELRQGDVYMRMRWSPRLPS